MTASSRSSWPSDGAGRAAMLSTPHVTVVVASVLSGEALDECLVALLDQSERTRAELIVARRAGGTGVDADVVEAVRRTHPAVRIVT